MAVEGIHEEKDQHNHEATGKNKLHKKSSAIRTRKTLSINTYTCVRAHTHAPAKLAGNNAYLSTTTQS